MPLRASGPPAPAWLLQQCFQHCCCAWRSPPGNPRTAALWGLAEQAVRLFLASLQVHSPRSRITPMQASVHVSPAHPKVGGKPLCQVRARGQLAARGRGESSQRCVLAAPPANWLCPAWGSRASLPPRRLRQEPLPGAGREFSGAAYAPGTAPPSQAARGRAFRPG